MPQSCANSGNIGDGNKTLQVMWVGGKYAVTENLDVIAAYFGAMFNQVNGAYGFLQRNNIDPTVGLRFRF